MAETPVAATPTVSIDPMSEGTIDGEPPKDFTWAIAATGVDRVKASVFQVSADGQRWTIHGNAEMQEVPLSNGRATFTGTLRADRDRLVVKTLDNRVERVTGGVAFNRRQLPGGDALTRARRVIAPWRYGVNVERGDVLWSGWLTDDVLRHYRDSGVTHIRIFPPSGGRFALMSVESLDLWIHTAKRANALGLGCHLDILDVMGIEHMSDDLVDHVRRCAVRIRDAGVDPNKTIVGAVNEYAGGDRGPGAHQLYHPWRIKFDDALHAELPNFVIVTNGGYWGDPGVLVSGGFQVRIARPQIIQWHLYDWNAGDPGSGAYWHGQVSDWVRANGDPVTYCGEWGIGPPDNSNGAASDYSKFPTHILNAARGMGRQRPTHWTVTKGGWWRLNEGDSARLRPEIASAIREGSGFIAGQDWYE